MLPQQHAAALDLALRYAAWALHAPAGQAQHGHGVLFREPHKLDPQRLVPVSTVTEQVITRHGLAADHLRRREGFALTDPGGDLHLRPGPGQLLHLVPQPGQGFVLARPAREAGGFKHSALGVPLQGCPLDERISEMNLLKSQGYSVGALAMVTVDNPMVAGTGHRICNDCSKACIYQKQEPVDIPQVETRTLRDVLDAALGLRDLQPADALEPART